MSSNKPQTIHGQLIELTIEEGGLRLDKAISDRMLELSRTQVQNLIKVGRVMVNGRSVKASHKLEGGEQIAIDVPPVIDSDKLIPEEIPLDIRYEDDDIIVINKPAGMVTHPSLSHETGTLANAVLGYCPDVLGVGGEKRPGIVHRLDKYTSGVIVVAKNDQALWYLQAQFKERTVKKVYMALVVGQMQPPEAIIDAPIGRHPNHRKKMWVITGRSIPSRPSQTEYHTHTSYDNYTLLECHPRTGRKHQIRVHLAYVGYPIVGDHIYGRRKQPFPELKRHFLHAAQITFQRPSDEQEITITADLPPELQTIIDQLNHN